MQQRQLIVLGLGTNQGERSLMLKRAVEALALLLADIQRSSVYESEALLLPGSPPEWNMPYLNMAIKGYSILEPHALLAEVKAIEQKLGRQDRGRWSPREIDIDILAYGDQTFSSDSLSIPHISLLERAFALQPFAEIHPHWRYPVPGCHYGKTAGELWRMLSLRE